MTNSTTGSPGPSASCPKGRVNLGGGAAGGSGLLVTQESRLRTLRAPRQFCTLPLRGLPLPPHPHECRWEAGSSQFLQACSPDGCVAASPQAQLLAVQSGPTVGGERGHPRKRRPGRAGRVRALDWPLGKLCGLQALGASPLRLGRKHTAKGVQEGTSHASQHQGPTSLRSGKHREEGLKGRAGRRPTDVSQPWAGQTPHLQAQIHRRPCTFRPDRPRAQPQLPTPARRECRPAADTEGKQMVSTKASPRASPSPGALSTRPHGAPSRPEGKHPNCN